MSPSSKEDASEGDRFPRVSGDEPGGTDQISNLRVFSPRERG